MARTTFLSTATLLALSGAALAEVPHVAADITPVHGLVARVMQGLGEPDLVVAPGASPHGYSLRPSEAQALSQADVVFWMAEPLTPWLQGPLEELAANAHRVELLETEGTLVLPFREGTRFEAHDHDDHAEGHGDHGDHADHDEHEEGHDDHDHAKEEAHAKHDDHDDHEGHDHEDHAEEHGHDGHEGHDDHDDHEDHADGHDGHDHEGEDPHAWLLPSNAQLWLDVIAEELAEHDPENAATYRANAEAGKQEIAETVASISTSLKPFQDKQFIVFHDAYQYFEKGFGLNAAGAISIGDASKPSAARVAEVRDVVADLNVTCVFSEPQFNPGMVAAVLDGTGAGTAVLDPLGASLELGPQFYTALLKEIGAAIAGC